MVQLDDAEISLAAGRLLASPPPGEEVVISGISGIFPNADSVTELAEKLFNKQDLISSDRSRWTLKHPELPLRTGVMNNATKCDAGFFGIHSKQLHSTDPMGRILLEKTAEAILDSGFSPSALYGKNIGVFIGACFNETERSFDDNIQMNGFAATGCARSMLANRISYWLGIRGPSYVLDTACSSSMYALDAGYRAIREGDCDAAIVGGSNLCMNPYVSLQFARLGVLSKDAKSKCFDDAANGYCRSEGVSVMFLQKMKVARRVYATIVHCKSNSDGYKEQGITYPSGTMQQVLLEQFYCECNVDPSTVFWIEAHATGTKVGDPEEVKSIENVFCKNRNTPLKIGSLKCNTGHSEPASGILSLTKVLISMETLMIPPNIYFHKPRKEVEGLHNGSIEVITETTKWEGGLASVNCFGFGGANSHVLLKSNQKSKLNNGLPLDNLPRLITVSGRTEEAVDTILSDLETHPLDVNLTKLYHDIFKDCIPAHVYRGFTLMAKEKVISNSIKKCTFVTAPVYYFFPALVDWKGHIKEIMKIPLFSQILNECCNILKTVANFNVEIILSEESKSHDEYRILKMCIIQIAMVKFLNEIGCKPAGVFGISYGEIACAYADGVLSLKEALFVAYHIATLSAIFPQGQVAITGISYHKLKNICPPNLYITLKSPNSCLISGPSNELNIWLDQVKKNKTLIVNPSTVTTHNSTSGKDKLSQALQKVIKGYRRKTGSWLIGEEEDSNRLITADYFFNCVFKEIHLTSQFTQNIPPNSFIFEFSPEPVLEFFLAQSVKETRNVTQILDKSEDSLNYFLTSLGRLYESGLEMNLSLLYPEVTYPVPRGTRMISPLIKWDHSSDWFLYAFKPEDEVNGRLRYISKDVNNEENLYIRGHVIDGRNLYPATGYLVLVWETLALMHGKFYEEMPVVFENVCFYRATNVPKEGKLNFFVTILPKSGNFEIIEGETSIVKGRISIPEDISKETFDLDANEASIDRNCELKSKDIYKEFHLRGYNYSGLFRSIVTCKLDGTFGLLEWHKNWTAFMDNMLQLQLLNFNTRGLFIPTCIEKVVINPVRQRDMIDMLPDATKVLPAFYYKYSTTLVSGGVEIKGLNASAVNKRKITDEPVLEKYQFTPHNNSNLKYNLNTVLRIYVHIILENIPTVNVKIFELGDMRAGKNKYMSLLILNILEDLPLIQPEAFLNVVPGKEPEESHPRITLCDKRVADESVMFAVGSGLLKSDRKEALNACIKAVQKNGFIVTIENNDEETDCLQVEKCCSYKVADEFLILLRKTKAKEDRHCVTMEICDREFGWIQKLKELFKRRDVDRIMLIAENNPVSGIIGFMNCIIKEGYYHKTRCYFIMDQAAPKFSLEDPFYKQQIKKDLSVNVYKNGEWGSYRHFLFKGNGDTVETPHAYTTFLTRGDVSSATWVQGQIPSSRVYENDRVIHVYYSALNFRDVMTSTGKLAYEAVQKNRLEQDCTQGLEFSGRDSRGKRVMGLAQNRGIATMVDAERVMTWNIPIEWTLEDAATVPCVYNTIVYALDISGGLKKGETVLVHSGTGGVGQAAINYCLFYGCNIITTVGTPEKRKLLMKIFPQLKENQIGSSRDISFEQLVKRETNGRGVDIVFNSLAEEKLLASIRCLARGGRFLELGKFDLANNNLLDLEFLNREANFYSINLNLDFTQSKWKRFNRLFENEVKKGSIKPLNRTVFERDQVEQALRYMSAGKHTGKVLIKIRKEEEKTVEIPKPFSMKAKPRYYCNPKKAYIILGGLGGFGLELCDWLVLRGAKKLIVSSRSGVQTGYQLSRINSWQALGVTIEVVVSHLNSEQECASLLETASTIGPVGGIFNLAVVLSDNLFENQTEESFECSLKPKAEITRHLDRLSRSLCPSLNTFAVFSSVSCGRGNVGQTNYGMANSVMERICEQRVEDGFPGLAIQWGAVGDVGIVANMAEDNTEIIIGGTIPQKIQSCLNLMDEFLCSKNPVLASMVVAEKKSLLGKETNIVDTVMNILGIKELKSVSLHSNLAELGMDSLMAVEIKQTLEREFEIFLTPQDIRGMTFSKLQNINDQKINLLKAVTGETVDKVTDFIPENSQLNASRS